MYTGEGPRHIEIGVAVAPSWNNLVRIYIEFATESNRPGLEICAGLDRDAVDALITILTTARDKTTT